MVYGLPNEGCLSGGTRAVVIAAADGADSIVRVQFGYLGVLVIHLVIHLEVV